MLLSSNNLSFKYNNQTSFSYPNIKLSASQSLLVLGKSGSGKTTFLHLLAGFLTPLTGKTLLKDIDFSALSQRKRDLVRGKNIGIVFQQPHFMKSLTAYKNVLLACKAAGLPIDNGYLKMLFKELSVEGKENTLIKELSIGEQQRISIIRALANRPGILLADEPTSSLDDENCMQVVALLKKAAEVNNSALVIVTHDMRLKNEFKDFVVL